MPTDSYYILHAYGASLLYAHYCEHVLRDHLTFCSQYAYRAYSPPADMPISEQSFAEMIDQFGKLHPDEKKLRRQLHLIRKLRNALTHDFVIHLGDCLKSTEGKEDLISILTVGAKEAQSVFSEIRRKRDFVFHEIFRANGMSMFPEKPPQGFHAQPKREVERLLRDLETERKNG